MSSPPDPRQNHLLAALPEEDYARFSLLLEWVQMPLGKVLYEPGIQMRHVYFPTNSIVSLLYVMEDGSSAEIAVVGNEGVVGVSLFMGGETTPSRAVVQSAGYAYRLKVSMANRFDPLLAINFDPPQPQNHSLIFASDGSFHHPA